LFHEVLSTSCSGLWRWLCRLQSWGRIPVWFTVHYDHWSERLEA